MYITNHKELTKTALRKKALAIVEAGYGAIEIQSAIKNRIKMTGGILSVSFPNKKKEGIKIDLHDYKRVFLVGIGKGSALASVTLAGVLKDKMTRGIAIDVQTVPSKHARLELIAGTHPLPSMKNVKATQKIMRMVSNLEPDDLVIVFMCGGGSALAVASEDELDNSLTMFKELTKAGANIIELNTVRKHLSDIKGGNFASIIYPAASLALMVSDVLGDDISMIASGPTVCDTTSKADALAILKKYRIPLKGIELRETPKEQKCFKNVQNVLFVSNTDAVNAMAEHARTLGFKSKIASTIFQGEAKTALIPLVQRIKKGEAIIMGGETTVTLRDLPAGKKPGKGGRNQEAALGVLATYHGKAEALKGIVALSYASDGHDNTNAAGAIADAYALGVADKLQQPVCDALTLHASFDFFTKNKSLIEAKQSCFNVADLMLVIREQ